MFHTLGFNKDLFKNGPHEKIFLKKWETSLTMVSKWITGENKKYVFFTELEVQGFFWWFPMAVKDRNPLPVVSRFGVLALLWTGQKARQPVASISPTFLTFHQAGMCGTGQQKIRKAIEFLWSKKDYKGGLRARKWELFIQSAAKSEPGTEWSLIRQENLWSGRMGWC